MHWKKITLLGVGLMGGSLGKALRARHLADSVVGWVRRKATISEAINCAALDHATLDLQEAVSESDLLVLCTPLGVMDEILKKALPFLHPKTLITDVGSAKKVICDRIELCLTNSPNLFIGSHPMAGAEKSGVSEASEDLFEDALCIITPTDSAPNDAVNQIAGLWKNVGAKVKKMSPEKHDASVSKTSHLPHVVASILAKYILNHDSDDEQRLLCASGFRDTTRIAAGETSIWKDILNQNGKALTSVLDEFLDELKQFRNAIEKADELHIEKVLHEARRSRLDWESNSINSKKSIKKSIGKSIQKYEKANEKRAS